MFNLLPQEHQKKLKKEYLHRRSTLILIAFFCLGIIGILTFIPSFILSLQRAQSIPYEYKVTEEDSSISVSELNHRINDLKNDVTTVLKRNSVNQINEIFKNIIDMKPAGISLKGLSYKKQNKEPLKVYLAGVALTREDLLSFARKLEMFSLFEHVNVPVSSFAKDKDIEFSLELVENIKK